MNLIPYAACGMLACSAPALAMPYTFAALPSGFTATALNDGGQIAGTLPPLAGANQFLPALYSNGAVTTLNVPLSFSTVIAGINDAGDLLGVQHFRFSGPFAVFGGVLTTVAAPIFTSAGANAFGLNNNRQIVGSAPSLSPANGTALDGYLSSGAGYTLLDVPGAYETQAEGINDARMVVGRFQVGVAATLNQGFLFNAGAFTTLDVPGAVATDPLAINNAGEVAGTYTDAAGAVHGFTETGGLFTDITGAGGAFLPVGLNNNGQLIGTFGGTGLSFLATPQAVPEPASMALLGLGALGVGGLRARRR